MNILLLTRKVSKEIAGSAYVFSMLIDILVKNGHKVWVITEATNHIVNHKKNNVKIIYVSLPNKKRKGRIVEIIKYNLSSIKILV